MNNLDMVPHTTVTPRARGQAASTAEPEHSSERTGDRTCDKNCRIVQTAAEAQSQAQIKNFNQPTSTKHRVHHGGRVRSHF